MGTTWRVSVGAAAGWVVIWGALVGVATSLKALSRAVRRCMRR